VAKAGVIQLTKITALEYARDGIRANCVCPGSFQSPMLERLPDAAVEQIVARHPLGLGDADALAAAFVYLASDDALWTTGTALVVDGGYSLP
jgi:3-oxoacyl-[acyl-carrier protein] reductase